MSKQTGKIKKFFEDKGYGFIESDRNDTFFHVNDCTGIDTTSLAPGIEVSYEVATDQRGKTKAVNLEVIG